MPYEIENGLTIQQLTTGFSKQGQKSYVNILHNSNHSSSNMMKTYLATQLQAQMAVQEQIKKS